MQIRTATINKCIGKLLIEYGLKIALKNHKKVKLQSTINAEGFYKKHGFTKIKDEVITRNTIKLETVIMEYSTPNTNNHIPSRH